jgi:aminopeptidase
MKQTNNSYLPPSKILDKYAQVLVKYALGATEGIQAGEVVQCAIPDIAKPLYLPLQREILKAGGHPLMRLLPTGTDKEFFELANDDQLTFMPKQYFKAKAKLIDHSIAIIADPFPQELESIDPRKIIKSRDAKKLYRELLTDKETQGKFTWTVGLWGVEAKAKIAGLTLKEYWQEIINACFLDHSDPIEKWRQVNTLQNSIRQKLNRLPIKSLHVSGKGIDLKVGLGSDRIWKGGANRNIPSFELFTSPNWRETEGFVEFDQPVYRYGNLIEGIRLEFKSGIVTSATAKKGQKVLNSMLQSKNANKLGEFSLTDNRLSNINHFMAETLYDENMGGPEGNMHVAIGMAYKDCYKGDATLLKKKDWQRLGFNDSPEHTDIINTVSKTVVATLNSGQEILLYKDGRFQI